MNIQFKIEVPDEDIKKALMEFIDILREQNSLPEVTADDNGKVLGVVDGEWATMSLQSVGYSVVCKDIITEEPIANDKVRFGLVGETVTVIAPTIHNYRAMKDSESLTLTATESENVITFNYYAVMQASC